MIREDKTPQQDEALSPERPVNALAALTLVLVFPRETFRRLAARPHWFVPILFIVAAVVAKSLLSLGSGVLDEALQSEALRTGVDITLVQTGAPVAFIASGLLGVPVVMLLQALFFMAIGKLFGGRIRFVVSLSTIAYASVPIAVGALAAAALIPLTHSADLGSDLSRFVDPVTHPFLWGMGRELGIVPLWFYALVFISSGSVLGLPRRRARQAAITFVIVHVLIMSFLGMSDARTQVDPLASWEEVTTASAVLRFPEGTPRIVMDEAEDASEAAASRVRHVVGSGWKRIECFVYPSLGEKERATGNAATAHGVTWANAVHVAWEGSSEVALAREMAKVSGARALGKMYNPFIADGLAVHVGEYWGGRPIVDVARELYESGSVPPLEDLIEPSEYAVIERHVGEVAAGAFTSFLVDELGVDSYREMYSYISRKRAPLRGVLERVMSDSLGAIENRWVSYIMGAPVAAGEGTPTE